MSDEKAPKQSRYERVKEILNTAAGSSCPSYQGYGKFWNLPLQDFLKVTIYGVRMIAPPDVSATGPKSPPVLPMATGGSCCHGAAPAAPSPTPAPADPSCCSTASDAGGGRGAASGLIIGLRGQFPFDGSQFPRLLWGGTPVGEADIQFIQDWIDAGCPSDDAQMTHIQVRMNAKMALAQGHEAHPLHTGPTNAFRDDLNILKVRKNIAYLSPEELQRFRNVVGQLKSLNAYPRDSRSWNSWAGIHADLCQHGWEEFLTWHRAYLYFFELQLQDFDSSVTLPYWDWAADKDNVMASIADIKVTDHNAGLDNGTIPDAYKCWLDDDAIARLKKGGIVSAEDLAKLQDKVNQKFDSGPRLFKAANVSYTANPASTDAIQNELARVNTLWHRFRWPGGNHDLIFEMYPTPDDVNNILQIDNFFDYGSGPANNHFFGALENIHNLIHNFSGGFNPNWVVGTANRIEPEYGDMVNAGFTAYDPIFWGHHSNIDRLWAEWQKLHVGQDPDDPTAVLPPWKMNVSQTLNTANLGYEYVQQAFAYPTDNTIPVARFKSAPAPVHPNVVKTFRHARVRLHKVQFVTRAGFHIRVFINEPDANDKTATLGNDHYLGTVNTFTGLCIGGPGHCDPPPPHERRHFDKRARSHKTPGNFVLDATGTIKKLAAAGDSQFNVNLVVLNTDGTPANDALHFDAVTLNFLD